MNGIWSFFKSGPPDSPERVRCWSTLVGNTLNSDQDFIKRLSEKLPGLELSSKEWSDIVLQFCPVVSRAGTDIEAAVQKLHCLPASKPAVLVVLHHTFDPEFIVPESSRNVTRENTVTVDCLFHEDRGLLSCQRNQRALERVTQWIQFQVKQQKKSQPALQNQTLAAKVEKLERENEELKKSLEFYINRDMEEQKFLKEIGGAVVKEGTVKMVWVDDPESEESEKSGEKDQAGPSTDSQLGIQQEEEKRTEAYDCFKIQKNLQQHENTPQPQRITETVEYGDLTNYKKPIKEMRSINGTKTDKVKVVLPELKQVIWVPKEFLKRKMTQMDTDNQLGDQKTEQDKIISDSQSGDQETKQGNTQNSKSSDSQTEGQDTEQDNKSSDNQLGLQATGQDNKSHDSQLGDQKTEQDKIISDSQSGDQETKQGNTQNSKSSDSQTEGQDTEQDNKSSDNQLGLQATGQDNKSHDSQSGDQETKQGNTQNSKSSDRQTEGQDTEQDSKSSDILSGVQETKQDKTIFSQGEKFFFTELHFA